MEADNSRRAWSLANLNSSFSSAVLVCLTTTLCYLAPTAENALIPSPPTIWPLWPGHALLVCILLMVRRRLWPILIVAGFVGFVLYDLHSGVPIPAIAWFIAANTVQVLIAALCLRSFFPGVPQLNSVKALGKYSFAVILAPFLAAFLSPPGISNDYWSGWRIAFLSDVLAFLTLAPAILGWVTSGPAWLRKSRAHHLEAATLIAVLALLGYITLVVSGRPAILFSLVPLLLWSALRFGPTGVSTSMLIIAFLAIYGAVHGRGPLTGPDALYNVTSLQLFLLFTVTPFMVLATLVAERNRTEEVVSTLNRRLIVAQEQERRRIARELHDDIGQRLALLICELENVDDSPVGVRVSELSRQASEIAAAIRSLSHELHSSRLEYLGLTAAMRGFCEEFGGQEKVEIDFKAHDVPTDLPKTISLSFFRVLQEGLRNAAKHSGVRHFEVRLWGTSHEMHLTLTDFGVGFDREAAMKSGGLGLISMEERLKLVNGTFSIRSQPKRGTVIEACVPVPPEAFP